MFSRKQTPQTPQMEREKLQYYPKNNEILHSMTHLSIPFIIRCGALLFVSLSTAWFLLVLCWLVLVTFWFPLTPKNDVVQEQQQHHAILVPIPMPRDHKSQINTMTTPTAKLPFTVPTCEPSMSVYVYTLPPQFNLGLLDQCNHLSKRINMCPHVANSGLGQPLLPNAASWFYTNQFMAEIIFHARLANHPCRTWDPARASLFYVPFYGGLYSFKTYYQANATARNELALGLAEYVRAQPTWQRSNGRDHFMALGTVVWDFMGILNNDCSSDDVHRPNDLLKLPALKNMSVLIIERHPSMSYQHGIPYPSYFHPSTRQEMVTWQKKMRKSKRPHLFCFVGAPRKNKVVIRNEFIRQCGESTRCVLLNCAESKGKGKCFRPREVMRVMTRSRFCLQAPGDSATRRSTFDSVLAGCIPVFFSPQTAYTQYAWYLPEDKSTYSVYIDEKSNASKRIEGELMKISSSKVKMMREKLIDLIPTLTYANPNATNFGFRDAVDVALLSLANLVNKINK